MYKYILHIQASYVDYMTQVSSLVLTSNIKVGMAVELKTLSIGVGFL